MFLNTSRKPNDEPVKRSTSGDCGLKGIRIPTIDIQRVNPFKFYSGGNAIIDPPVHIDPTTVAPSPLTIPA